MLELFEDLKELEPVIVWELRILLSGLACRWMQRGQDYEGRTVF